MMLSERVLFIFAITLFFQIKLFKDNSNWGKYQTLTNSAFKTNEINVQVLVTWGLKEQDLDRCHHSDADCFGDTVWDDDFDMSSDAAQNDLLVCITIHIYNDMQYSIQSSVNQ